MMKKTVLALSLVASCMAVSLPAFADESNPAIVHRQGIYQIAGGHMTAIKSILFLGFEAPQDVTFHAQSLLDAFAHMGNSYPPGSDQGETKAKPEIWQNFDKVKDLAKNTREAASKLVEVSKGGDKEATMVAFKQLGGTCKACHDDFRKK
jgi:cytochrome c556